MRKEKLLIKLVILTLTAFFIYSCSGESTLSEIDTESHILSNSSKKANDLLKAIAFGTEVTKDEAILMAKETWQNSMRSSFTSPSTELFLHTEWIETDNPSITKSARMATESNRSIPLYFVYNPHLEKTIIISGDTRLPKVLAEANGHLTMQETDTGYDEFIKRLPIYISKTLNNSVFNEQDIQESKTEILFAHKDENTSSIVSSSISPTGREPWQRTESSTEEIDTYECSPLIFTKWAQGEMSSYGNPYNYSLNSISCGGSQVKPYTGCVAVAISQILAYHKYPKSITYGGSTWTGDWATIASEEVIYYLPREIQIQISELMKIVGSGVKMNYECTGSGANVRDAHSFFNNTLNYKTGGIQDYSFGYILKSIKDKQPVYIRAKEVGSSSGHAWIIDGAESKTIAYRSKTFVYTGYDDIPTFPFIDSEWRLIDETYSTEAIQNVYCNYGWSGVGDGKYSSGVFNPSGSNYTEGIQIIPYIKP